MRAGARSWRGRKEPALHVGAGDHARERNPDGPVADAQAGDRRAGTNAAQSPSDAEDGGASQRAAIEGRGVLREALRSPWFREQAWCEMVSQEGHHDRAAQHQQQAHVAAQQESEHHFGLHHRGQREAEAEQGAGCEHEREGAGVHASTRTRCAVVIAVARNIATASIDDPCSEAMPQMPWPAVHPLESLAPNPARNPPVASCHAGTCVRKGSPADTIHANAPSTMPAAYTRRHPRLDTKRSWRKYGACEKNDHTVVNTVLIPPMSPVETNSRLIPAPRSNPP